MKNDERLLVKIIKEVCTEEGITYTSFSYDWIFRLTKNDISRHIIGSTFELNSSAAMAICKDKCAASDIMLNQGIPCVAHHFFISPGNLKYVGEDGNWEKMLKYLAKYKRIVCKPNEGTSGNDVLLAETKQELEAAVSKIFAKNRTLAICPYYEIDHEYRLIILNHQVELVFLKHPPFVMGNGQDNLLTLMAKSGDTFPIKEFDQKLDYYYVPLKNEKFRLNWKHNLGLGASASVVTDQTLINELSTLAIKATKALNAKFVSVDIVETTEGLKIIEVNGGVSMDHFASMGEDNYVTAKAIYQDAINLMFKASD